MHVPLPDCMLQGDSVTKDEHKGLLLDRAFRVCSTCYTEKPLCCAFTNRNVCTAQALQLLNSEYAQALSYLESTRANHLDASGVHFTVGKTWLAMSPLVQQELAATDYLLHMPGTVIRHKKYGYKGVIYAWDRVCDR